MKRFWLVSVTLLCCLVAANVGAETADDQSKEMVIPLKDIWAYDMPGTRDIRELEPDIFGPKIRKLSSAEQLKKYEKSLTSRVLSQIDFHKPGQKANPGFAVAGIGVDALREAQAVLLGTKKPQTSFPANSELSVVFFSHPFGYYVYLDKVERQSRKIIISYHFVPHETKVVTRHFALIPLGKFSQGEVQVDIRRSLMAKNFIDAGFTEPDRSAESQVVAQSFRFLVKGESD